MAHVFSNTAFDYSSLNISRLYYDQVDFTFLHDIEFNGTTYSDVAAFTYDAGEYITGAFGGKNITFNEYGVTGGTVTGYVELIGNEVLWGIEKISYSAKALYNLALTSSNSDDLKALSTILNGNDSFDLSEFNDRVRGYNGSDKINGNGGNDILYGEAGNDTIRGGTGNDRLLGGLGNDTISLGSGKDILIFNSAPNTTSNHDLISDFKPVDDMIRLENAVFKKLGYTGALRSSNFVSDSSGHAHDSNDYIIYETDTGKLFYDSNGSASGGSQLIATLTNKAALGLADFFVI